MTDVPWFLLIFPIIGIALIIMTVRTWIRRQKFGISFLHLKTIPAFLGDVFRGKIETGVPLKKQTEKEFTVRLICAKRTSRLDKEGDRRVSEKKLWSEEQSVFGNISNTGPTFSVNVNFTIPNDLLTSELYPEDDRTLWRLEIASAVKGVDYAAQFEVPIYKKD